MADFPGDGTEDALLELDAMRALAQALQSLGPSSRRRVLGWAMDRFGTPSLESTSRRVETQGRPLVPLPTASPPDLQRGLADLYAECDPQTDADKTLVVAYWVQDAEGSPDVDAQRVNYELKQLGHGVGNITRAFDKLKGVRPQLMIQTKKSGTTKQARKSFRVTAEGKKYVQGLLKRSLPE